jgi:hypothetical protein
VTTSINFSGAQLVLSAISLWDDDFVPNAWQTVLAFWAVMLICMSVNIFGAKYLDLINKICIYWTGASVIIIMITLLAMSDNYRSGEFVFEHYEVTSGWTSGWAFFVGLLQASYTLTGYGMVAAMCEEVQVRLFFFSFFLFFSFFSLFFFLFSFFCFLFFLFFFFFFFFFLFFFFFFLSKQSMCLFEQS